MTTVLQKDGLLMMDYYPQSQIKQLNFYKAYYHKKWQNGDLYYKETT